MSATVTGTPVSYTLPVGGESSSSFAVTVPAGATHLCVYAGNTLYNPTANITSVKWNTSEALTKAIDQITQYVGADDVEGEWWSINSPTAGTLNVDIVWDRSAVGCVDAMCIAGGLAGIAAVGQSPPSGSTTSSVDCASTTNGIILAGISARDDGGATAVLAAGTERANLINTGSGTTATRVATASQPGTGGIVTTTWTVANSNAQAAAAIAISGSAAASSPHFTSMNAGFGGFSGGM
jgi:hypothetical protein